MATSTDGPQGTGEGRERTHVRPWWGAVRFPNTELGTESLAHPQPSARLCLISEGVWSPLGPSCLSKNLPEPLGLQRCPVGSLGRHHTRGTGLGSVPASTREAGAVGGKLKVTQAEVDVVPLPLPSTTGVPTSPSVQAGEGALDLWRRRCCGPPLLACPSALTQVQNSQDCSPDFKSHPQASARLCLLWGPPSSGPLSPSRHLLCLPQDTGSARKDRHWGLTRATSLVPCKGARGSPAWEAEG